MKGSLYFLWGVFGVVSATTSSPRCTIQDQDKGEKQLKFYYSEEKKACLPFYFDGTGVDENCFNSDKECMEANGHNDLYPEGGAVCSLDKEQGLCYARQLKYYYNKEEGTCRTFIYGGCGGNGNRFDSRQDCQNTCQAKAGRSGGMVDSGSNPDEHSVDSGLIACVLGGCIFAVALISAIAVLIQKKTKNRKKVPTKEIEMS